MEKRFIEMQQRGIQPTRATYETLMHAFGRAGDVGTLLRYWEEMLERAMDPAGDRSTAPDHDAFVTLMRGLARVGSVKAVRHQMHEMTSRYGIPVSVHVYNQLLAAHVAARDPAGMQAAFKVQTCVRVHVCVRVVCGCMRARARESAIAFARVKVRLSLRA